MPINRGPFNALVDDNGSGTTGSVWNKAAIQSVLLDPIDAAFGPADVVTWTPTDSSGAGLAVTVSSASYIRIGRMINIWFNLSYPANANSLRARISGIPTIPAALGACYLAYGTPKVIQIATDAGIYFFNATTAVDLKNSDLSGAIIACQGSYITT